MLSGTSSTQRGGSAAAHPGGPRLVEVCARQLMLHDLQDDLRWQERAGAAMWAGPDQVSVGSDVPALGSGGGRCRRLPRRGVDTGHTHPQGARLVHAVGPGGPWRHRARRHSGQGEVWGPVAA